MDLADNQENELFRHRQAVLEQAFRTDQQAGKSPGPLRLETLLAAIHQAGEADPALASLYFAGNEDDHPFFLKNSQVAIALSVLPQDAAKTTRWRHHPHQHKVIVVLVGEILLQVL